jgi:pimeloyl-ACP methyl ester carboxylesterase
MDPDPELLDVPVAGGPLRVARWGSGDRAVLAGHGITGSSISWRGVARRLGADWTFVAVDLRGRGGSRTLPGPYGLARHADDMIAAAEHLGLRDLVLTGHSMGAFVAALAGAARPDLFARVVLVDGGLPLSISLEGLDPDAVVEATLGPSLARLSQTFESIEAYFDFWRAHPAMGPAWNEDIEAYLRYDLVGEAPALRPAASEPAVRADGREILTGADQIGDALRRLEMPVVHLRAPLGLMNEPSPLQPDALVKAWAAQIADFTDVFVPDTNHFSLLLAEPGASAICAALERGEPPGSGTPTP